MNWISVKDKLPEYSENVLVHFSMYTEGNVRMAQLKLSRTNDRNIWAAYYLDGFFDVKSDVTHWMPLPKPPEKEIGKPKITKQKDGSTIVNYKIKKL